MDDQLGRHDEILKAHRERFEAHKQWLQGQRSTPSFQQHSGIDASPIEPTTPPTGGALQRRGSNPTTPRGHDVSSLTPARTGPVHEELIDKGKIYEQNKEKLREEAVRKQLAAMRPTPKVSSMAQQIRREDKIEERFRKLELDRRQMEEWNRAKYLRREEDEQNHSFKPKISKKGRRATSRASALENNSMWQQKREEEREALRTKKIIAEMAEVRGTPEIDERSARLAERKKQRDGLEGFSHLDTMLERDRLSRLSAWERQQHELRNSQPGNPRITAYAATMPRDGDVFDRLYSTSYENEAKRAVLHQSRVNEEGMECSYSPRITRNASSIVRERPVEEDLLDRHAQSRAMQEEQVRLMMERERDLHTPAINPVSDEIASRLPETSRERLYKPKSRYYDPTEYPFQPNLGHNSSQDDTGSDEKSGRKQGADTGRRQHERIDQMYQREMQRQEKLDQLRAEEEDRMMADCTFRPTTRFPSGRTDSAAQPLRVYNRVTQWARRRDQKIIEQRQEKTRQELAECSFRPDMSTTQSPQRSEASNNNTIYDGNAWGYDEFVERQREARRRQQEKATKGWTTGDRWRNEVTVPQEFQLGKRDKPIRSLQKPLEAPIQPPHMTSAPEVESYLEDRASVSSSLQGSNLPPPGAFSDWATRMSSLER
eukprot:PhM_4_TR8081/c0_g1_i1/m.5988